MEQALVRVLAQLGLPAGGRGLPSAALRVELEAASKKLLSAEVGLRRLHVDLVSSPDRSPSFHEHDEELSRVRTQLNAHIEQTASRIRSLREIAAYALDRPD